MAPPLSNRIVPLRTSLFATLAERLRSYSGKRYPFHIGDNVLLPPESARFGTVDLHRLGNPYNYGHPSGELALREAVARKCRETNGIEWATPGHVQIVAGATHGLTCAVQCVLDPGDEVLILTPYWPLMRGIVNWSAATPVEVPFYQRLLDEPDLDPRDLILPYVGHRTRAIYVITPNNPNGIVLSAAQLEAIAGVARERDLWVLSDEAYEAYAYRAEHVSLAALPEMRDRTITVFSLSKTFAMAGLRVGYVVGPERLIDPLRKVATHSVYNVAQACQSMALAALGELGRFSAEARATYQEASRIVAARLRAKFHPAQGGAYVFVDLRERGPDAMPVLMRAAERGVTLAPGAIFGAGYEGYARFCYTAVDRETLEEVIEVLSEVLTAG